MLLSCVLILSLLGAVTGWTMCYSEDECYSVAPPFGNTPDRPLLALPVPTALRWFLYARCLQDQNQELFPSDVTGFSSSKFDFNKKTKIIIHGYTQSAHEPWVAEMCQEILKVDDVNCITLDWSSGSFSFYAQAVNICRYIGKQVARFLKMLEETHSYPSSNVHIVGHSLGGQIGGYAGKYHKGIGRITGLDPAGPLYQNSVVKVRLDSTDAIYVDAIHTNGKALYQMGLGMKSSVGHDDFYPNGGQEMPECPDSSALQREALCILNTVMGPINCSESVQSLFSGCDELVEDKTLTIVELKGLFDVVFCNHFQVIRYFTESISNPEKYKAYPCDSVEDCIQGISGPCPKEGCPIMGYHAKPSSSSKLKRYTMKTV